METDSGWVKTDVLVPRALLESAAQLGLRLDALWGLGNQVEAAAVLAALQSGAEGLLAQVEDESSGQRLEVLAEPPQYSGK
ncbi:MAG: hypothetical protein M1389_01710 [Chloroflexi bacterium]|nr:hypothetical protein [Chloroflexota bacterium]